MSYERNEIIQLRSGLLIVQGTSWSGEHMLFRSEIYSTESDGMVVNITQDDEILYGDGHQVRVVAGEKKYSLKMNVRMITGPAHGSRRYDLTYGNTKVEEPP